MSNIYFLGECMVELRAIEANTMHQSFAGDVYNSAVYLKRCFPAIRSSIVTAVGQDNLSTKMLEVFEAENINASLAFRHNSKVPGMYLIETDDTGERSFTYWRSDSAARKVVDFLNTNVIEQFKQNDMFFFSGISLAVIEEGARDIFWQKLAQIQQAGVKIVFDPNYRARLWRDEAQAKAQFEQAFKVCDLALPGVEDLAELYSIETTHEVIDFCHQYNINEVIVKNGPASVITSENGAIVIHEITPVTHVVDTTSAGDAFNGVYLGARLSGRNVSDAVQLAAKAAGTVIQHPGAIAPKADFLQSMSEADLSPA